MWTIKKRTKKCILCSETLFSTNYTHAHTYTNIDTAKHMQVLPLKKKGRKDYSLWTLETKTKRTLKFGLCLGVYYLLCDFFVASCQCVSCKQKEKHTSIVCFVSFVYFIRHIPALKWSLENFLVAPMTL